MITDTGDDPPSLFQHNINTNLQVCSGNMTGLPEIMDTYFKFYEDKFDDFRLDVYKRQGKYKDKTARVFPGDFLSAMRDFYDHHRACVCAHFTS